MASGKNKKSRKAHQDKSSSFDDLSPQAKQAIVAVLIALLAVFLTASLFSYGGRVGLYIDEALRWLFGFGAYLAPLVCVGFVITFLRPKEDSNISITKILGIVTLFFSTLGLINLVDSSYGGMVGLLLEWPLVYLIGDALAGTFLVALTIISLVLIFNTGLQWPRWGATDNTEDEPEKEVSISDHNQEEKEDTDQADTSKDTESEEVEPTPAPTKGVRDTLGIGKKSEPNFLVSNFNGPYDPPPLSLLGKDKGKAKTGDVKANANIIKRTLKEFGINVEMDTVEIGPTVTRYALKPAQGVKISRIVGLQRELELNLASGTLRIEAPIPGKSLVGIEVPNSAKAVIGLSSLLQAPEYTDSPKPLQVALGKDITGNAHFSNIARMPHALIAGTTGSGKSVMIHNIIISLLYRNSPDQLRFLMVDPKRVELTMYDGIPHLLTPVITEAKKTLLALKWAVKEMERRYDILQSEKVQNIDSYHQKIYHPARTAWEEAGSNEEEKEQLPEALPYIVIIIDELADLMHAYPRELEAMIVRIAQMARAVGIHLILATQRPSVNVITGTIKANIPTRLAFQVASQVDSRTILDQVGAERLLGQGDMLYLSGELSKPIRLQSAFISEDEFKRVVDYLKDQDSAFALDTVSFDEDDGNNPDAFFSSSIDGDDDDDELYGEAKQAVIEANKASTSFLQRKLRVGYSRAARLIDSLEERGVISPQDGSKPRTILASAFTEEDADEPEIHSEDEPDSADSHK